MQLVYPTISRRASLSPWASYRASSPGGARTTGWPWTSPVPLTPEAQRQIVQGITGVGAVSVQSHQEQVLSSPDRLHLVPAWVMSVDYRAELPLPDQRADRADRRRPAGEQRPAEGLFGGIFAGC